jgi:hypothetical protein
MKVQAGLKPISEFFIRVLSGTAIFGLIGGAAYLLKLLTESLETNHSLPAPMLLTLKAFEYIIFGSDALVFLVFLVKETMIAIGLKKPDP